MGKKKPKKSPSKSSPSKSPPPRSAPSPSKSGLDSNSPPTEDPNNGSDALIGFSADEVAHHSSIPENQNPSSDGVETSETVIVATATDPPPTSTTVATEVITESSSTAPLQFPTVDSNLLVKAPVVVPELSSVAPQSSLDKASDVTLVSSEAVATADSTLLAVADAKTGSLSSQSAKDIGANKGDDKDTLPAITPDLIALNASCSIGDPPPQVAVTQDILQQKESVQPSVEGNDLPIPALPVKSSAEAKPIGDWCARAKGVGKRLSKKGEAFILPSGKPVSKSQTRLLRKTGKLGNRLS